MKRFNWETIKIVDKQGEVSYISLEDYKKQNNRLQIAKEFNTLQEFYCLSLIYENNLIMIFMAYDILLDQYCHHIVPRETSYYKKQILNYVQTN